jgi:6-phosphogluconolactonase
MLLQGYAGTYAGAGNKSLWRFTVDTETGVLAQPEPVLEAADSKYLSVQDPNVPAAEQEHQPETWARAEKKAPPQLLAMPRKVNGRAGLAVVNLATEPLQVVGEYGEEQDCSAYVTGDGEFWYTANYHDGGVRIYKLAAATDFPGNKKMSATGLAGKVTVGAEKKSVGALANLKLMHKIETGHESGCHQILLAGQFLLAICLLRNQILIYDRTQNWQQVGTLDFPQGTGPRHGIFTRDGQTLFVVSELSNELFVFAVGKKLATKSLKLAKVSEMQNLKLQADQATPNDFLTLISAQPLLEPNNLPAAAAAIRLSPDEKFLYVSVRERNVICVFKLTATYPKVTADVTSQDEPATMSAEKVLPHQKITASHLTATKIQEISCGGEHPRDLVLTPDGRFVLAVNRYPGSIVSFRRDPVSGKLGQQISSINIPQAVSVVFTEGVPQ